MMRRLTCSNSAVDDRGFTLVEVLFATVVLFFVATALLGLAASTTITAQTATEKNLMVNEVNSFLEDLKGWDFDDLGMQNPGTGEVPGDLSDVTTMTVDGYDITIEPEVYWVDDPNIVGTKDFKLIKVTITAHPQGGGQDVTWVTETQVRDTDLGWGFGEFSATQPPEIEFKSGSPTEMQVVSGTNVFVGASATHPMENGLLTNMYFYVGAHPMRDAAWNMAQFTINGPSHSQDYYWDTLAVMDDGTTRFAPDGIRTLKVEVWDNVGQQAYKVRRVLVDNDPPPQPGAAWLEWATDGIAHVAWDAVMDGTDPAWAYFVGVDEDSGQAVWYPDGHTHSRCGDDVEATEYDIPVINGTYDDGFRRLRVRLYAESPATGMSAYTVSDPFVTPPPLTGTWMASRTTQGGDATCETTVDIAWTHPKFPVAGVEYNVWRGTTPDMSDAVEIHSAHEVGDKYFHDEIIVTGKKNSTHLRRYYYQLEAWVVPTGPGSDGSGVQVWSNVAGPTGDYDGYGDLEVTW